MMNEKEQQDAEPSDEEMLIATGLFEFIEEQGEQETSG